jgi:hypothetical protein
MNPATGTQIKFVKLQTLLRIPKYLPLNRRGTITANKLNQDALPNPPKRLVKKTIDSVNTTNCWEFSTLELLAKIPITRINHNKREVPKVNREY